MKDLNELVEKINSLRKDREISQIVGNRIGEFEKKQNENEKEWFLELCFCLMTANSSAKKVLEICESSGDDVFFNYSFDKLSGLLKEKGYRFYNKRAEYIIEARAFSDNLKMMIMSFDSEFEAREWLKKSIKGLGYKEASHFLRNMGYKNVAILDRHILRILHEYGLISEVPTNLSKKSYFTIEETLNVLAEKSGLSLAELDLFLWYLKTGEVLK